MLINRRNGLMAGGGWKNPYITDGLVAMWDGEWNAGPGEHRNDITEVVDLIANNNLKPSNSITANKNYVQTNRSYLFASNPSYFYNLICANSATIEIVSCCIVRDGRYCWFRDEGTNAATGFKETLYSVYNTGYSYFFVNGSSGSEIAYQFDISSPHSTAIFYNSTQCGVRHNAELVVTRPKVNSSEGRNNFVILTASQGTSSAPSSKLFCCRFYSRALTADEIAHNYAVDKARFNLP